jgi:RND family efflux transporter MFP subunit
VNSNTPLRGRARRALLIPLFALTALSGCRAADEPTKTGAPTPVRVRVVAEPAGKGASRFSGTIEPETKVDVSFKVGGYVREVAEVPIEGGGKRKIQEGDWVKKGTVLAVVRQDDYAARAAGAHAAVAEAKASARQAELDHDRLSKLLTTKTVAAAEVDAAKAKLDMANARVQAERARAGEASLSVADCTLKAPFEGVVLKRNVEVGQLAPNGSVAFTIADTRTMKVVFGAPDSLLDKLQMGGDVSIKIEALGKDLTGKISRIAPSADVRSRVFDVQADIPNQDDVIKTGMIASLQIPAGATAGTRLALPLTAVVRAPKDPRGFAVFVVDGAEGGETARVREVKLGDVLGNSVLVTAGLKAGERVIETGATLVSDNQLVRVVR